MDAGFAHGALHTAASDFAAAISADAATLALWQGLTPLGRNQFIPPASGGSPCWKPSSRAWRAGPRADPGSGAAPLQSF